MAKNSNANGTCRENGKKRKNKENEEEEQASDFKGSGLPGPFFISYQSPLL